MSYTVKLGSAEIDLLKYSLRTTIRELDNKYNADNSTVDILQVIDSHKSDCQLLINKLHDITTSKDVE